MRVPASLPEKLALASGGSRRTALTIAPLVRGFPDTRAFSDERDRPGRTATTEAFQNAASIHEPLDLHCNSRVPTKLGQIQTSLAANPQQGAPLLGSVPTRVVVVKRTHPTAARAAEARASHSNEALPPCSWQSVDITAAG